MKCYKPIIVSNVSALVASKRYAEIDVSTIDNLKRDIDQYQLPTRACPGSKPLFNGEHCIYCPEGTYYDLKDLDCYAPQRVSNAAALGNTGKVV